MCLFLQTALKLLFSCHVVANGITNRSSGDTIDAYQSAAANVAAASAPASITGGVLLDDSQLASITGSAASGSATPAPSG
jgi:hypothetical protein